MDKKSVQLGMNAGTASNRLIKDILFSFLIKEGCTCFRCGGELKRDNFSVEHITPWLDSGDPVGLFFDLENISFSHMSCNTSAARRPNKRYNSAIEEKAARAGRARTRWHAMPVEQRKALRQEKFQKYGC